MSTPSMAFEVDLPCPKCGERLLFGYTLVTPEGAHQHTHYVCRSWPHPGERCGWHGWVVPERDLAGEVQRFIKLLEDQHESSVYEDIALRLLSRIAAVYFNKDS